MSSEFDGLKRDRDNEVRLFSWGVTILQVGIGAVMLFALAVVLVVRRDLSAYESGRRAAGVFFPGMVVVVGASIAYQRRSKLVGAVLVLLLAFGLAGMCRLQVNREGQALSDDERTPLVLEGGRLRHPKLGFSVALPAEFQAMPMKAPPKPAYRMELFANRTGGDGLVVGLASARSEAEVREMFAGVTDSIGAGVEVVENDIVWNDHQRTMHRHYRLGSKHMHVRTYTDDYPDHRTLTVMVMTTSLDGDHLADVAASFER